jgi:cell division protein ZapA
MNDDSLVETTIQVLGKLFQIKCPESQAASVKEASDYLEEKMRYFRSLGISEFDKIAIISALNITDQLLSQKSHKETHLQAINQRLQALHDTVEQALER